MKDIFVAVYDSFLISDLLARCSRGGESQGLLDVLPDGHGAQDVEEDEAAVRHVVTEQIPVAQSLHPVDGGEGELGHNATIKNGIEH